MSKFNIGEIVLMNSKWFPELNGNEVTIIEVLEEEGGERGYVVDDGDEDGWWESALKKKPDNEEAGSWTTIEALTNWNPCKEAVQ